MKQIKDEKTEKSQKPKFIDFLSREDLILSLKAKIQENKQKEERIKELEKKLWSV